MRWCRQRLFEKYKTLYLAIILHHLGIDVKSWTYTQFGESGSRKVLFCRAPRLHVRYSSLPPLQGLRAFIISPRLISEMDPSLNLTPSRPKRLHNLFPSFDLPSSSKYKVANPVRQKLIWRITVVPVLNSTITLDFVCPRRFATITSNQFYSRFYISWCGCYGGAPTATDEVGFFQPEASSNTSCHTVPIYCGAKSLHTDDSHQSSDIPSTITPSFKASLFSEHSLEAASFQKPCQTMIAPTRFVLETISTVQHIRYDELRNGTFSGLAPLTFSLSSPRHSWFRSYNPSNRKEDPNGRVWLSVEAIGVDRTTKTYSFRSFARRNQLPKAQFHSLECADETSFDGKRLRTQTDTSVCTTRAGCYEFVEEIVIYSALLWCYKMKTKSVFSVSLTSWEIRAPTREDGVYSTRSPALVEGDLDPRTE